MNAPVEANNSIVEDVVNSDQVEMKRVAWTNKEDAILVDYIRKHVDANWKTVERECGLNRSADACRLRWLNHLKPGLKKGKITADEKNIIIGVHARIAEKVPGRTDNEVRNIWNTRFKRCKRDLLQVKEEKQRKEHVQIQQQPQQQPLNTFINSCSLVQYYTPPAPVFSSYFYTRHSDASSSSFQNSELQFAPSSSHYTRPPAASSFSVAQNSGLQFAPSFSHYTRPPASSSSSFPVVQNSGLQFAPSYSHYTKPPAASSFPQVAQNSGLQFAPSSSHYTRPPAASSFPRVAQNSGLQFAPSSHYTRPRAASSFYVAQNSGLQFAPSSSHYTRPLPASSFPVVQNSGLQFAPSSSHYTRPPAASSFPEAQNSGLQFAPSSFPEAQNSGLQFAHSSFLEAQNSGLQFAHSFHEAQNSGLQFAHFSSHYTRPLAASSFHVAKTSDLQFEPSSYNNIRHPAASSFQKLPNLIEQDFGDSPSSSYASAATPKQPLDQMSFVSIDPNFPSSSSSSYAAAATDDFLVTDQNNFPSSSSYYAAATDDQNQPSSSSELPSIQSTDVLNLPPIEEEYWDALMGGGDNYLEFNQSPETKTMPDWEKIILEELHQLENMSQTVPNEEQTSSCSVECPKYLKDE